MSSIKVYSIETRCEWDAWACSHFVKAERYHAHRTVRNYIPFLKEIQSNIQRAHTAHLHTLIHFDVPTLRRYEKHGSRSIIWTLSVSYCLHILCNRLLECDVHFEHTQFDALAVTSLPDFKEPPEPIMKCLVGPIYLEILKEELRLCRCE